MSAVDNPQAMVPIGPAAARPAFGSPPPPAAADEAGGTGLTARDLWRVLRQRTWLIAITGAVLYTLVVVATVLIYFLAPAFTAEAYVQYVPPLESGLSPMGEQILPKDYVALQLATESAKLKSESLLMDVLSQHDVQNTQFRQWYGNDFDKCLTEFRDMLQVAPVRDSYLIKVGLPLKNKKEAMLIVNKVVERHVIRSKNALQDEGKKKLDSLKTTQAEMTNQLEQVRRRIADLRAKQDMPAIEAERDVLAESIAVLQNTLSELKAREADVNAQLATVQGTDPRNLPISAEMRVIIEADPVLRYYRQQVEAFDIEIASVGQTIAGANHKYMQQLQSRRQGYFEKESARRDELIEDLRRRQYESLQQELARIRSMLSEVHEQLAEKQDTQKDLDVAIQTYNSLIKDEDALIMQSKDIVVALRDAENALAIQSLQGRLEAFPATREPRFPSRPNFLLYLGGGLLLSVLAAVGLAFLREVTDQAVRTPLDVARHGHLSVLGSIPRLDDEEADVDRIELATRRAPQSLVAESFRQIRTHLTFSGPLDSQRILLITSSRSGDGKTAVAVNLAVTFAQSGQRVLLIDCNFRRPAIRTAFEGTRSEGLSNVLVGRSRLHEVITKTELPNLDVLTSGPMPPNPAELLGSPQLRTVLAEARRSYERVLLDGPPCLLISDALVLATQVDATVLVARAGGGTRGALRRAREQLQRVGARVIGAILNGVQARAGGYFKQQYREFYDYTNEEVIAAGLPGGPPELDAGPPDDAPKDR